MIVVHVHAVKLVGPLPTFTCSLKPACGRCRGSGRPCVIHIASVFYLQQVDHGISESDINSLVAHTCRIQCARSGSQSLDCLFSLLPSEARSHGFQPQAQSSQRDTLFHRRQRDQEDQAGGTCSFCQYTLFRHGSRSWIACRWRTHQCECPTAVVGGVVVLREGRPSPRRCA
jgi:hypothetical protein